MASPPNCSMKCPTVQTYGVCFKHFFSLRCAPPLPTRSRGIHGLRTGPRHIPGCDWCQRIRPSLSARRRRVLHWCPYPYNGIQRGESLAKTTMKPQISQFLCLILRERLSLLRLAKLSAHAIACRIPFKPNLGRGSAPFCAHWPAVASPRAGDDSHERVTSDRLIQHESSVGRSASRSR